MVYIGQPNRQRVSLWVMLGILVAVLLLSNCVYAQGDNAASQPPSADTPSPEAGLEASQPTLEVPQPTEVQPVDASQANDAPRQPPIRNVETGLPLRSVVSPIRRGHLSLLSFTAFTIYDHNYQLEGVPQSSLGSQLTVFHALLMYSIERSRWNLNLQYRPYVWSSAQTTHTDFKAGAVDLQTGHDFGRLWRLNVSESFNYSPAIANSLGSAFNADYQENTASSNPFLSAGRTFWSNNANVALDRELNERSRLSFTFFDNYIVISGLPNQTGTTPSGTDGKLNGYGPGVKWSRQWNQRNTLFLRYNYRRQTYPGSTSRTEFQTAGVGYSRILKPSLTARLEIGPGWASASAPGTTKITHQTTLQGSAELFKQFAKGGVTLSFYRNNDFSGVISNSYNNRYNMAITQLFRKRWYVELSGSYVQQEFTGARTTTGELGWGQIGYLLSRNWSLFTSYRYYNNHAANVNNTLSGPQQMVSAGIRWAWKPEKTEKTKN